MNVKTLDVGDIVKVITHRTANRGALGRVTEISDSGLVVAVVVGGEQLRRIYHRTALEKVELTEEL